MLFDVIQNVSWLEHAFHQIGQRLRPITSPFTGVYGIYSEVWMRIGRGCLILNPSSYFQAGFGQTNFASANSGG